MNENHPSHWLFDSDPCTDSSSSVPCLSSSSNLRLVGHSRALLNLQQDLARSGERVSPDAAGHASTPHNHHPPATTVLQLILLVRSSSPNSPVTYKKLVSGQAVAVSDCGNGLTFEKGGRITEILFYSIYQPPTKFHR